jgi:ankyrin repeat protein
VSSEDEMMWAIRQCPPDGIGALLSEFYELVDGRLGETSALLQCCYLGRADVARVIAGRRRAIDVFEAAALGNVARLAELLDADPSLADAVARDGYHPLGLAAFFGQPEAAELLVARGADIAAPSANSARVTPLHAAVAAAQPRIVELLLARGTPVDARQQGGFTPLMSAAHRGDAAIVDLLLAQGADPHLVDDSGQSAAAHAATAGHAALSARLAAGAPGGDDAGQDDAAADDLQPA